MWDPDCAVRLAPADVADFYAAYRAAVPAALAAALKPWVRPLRRLVWLRTLTWCVRWRVLSKRDDGWSKARLAEKAGVSPSHVSRVEAGILPLAGKALIDYAEAMDCPPAALCVPFTRSPAQGVHFRTNANAAEWKRDRVVAAIETIKAELRERLDELVKAGKLVEAQRLEQRTRFDLEMLQEVGHCKGIENYTRHLSGSAPGEPPPTLVDYLPNDSIMFLDESHVLVGQLGGMYNGDRARKTTLVEYGFRLPSALDNRPLKFEEFERKMHQAVFVSATPADYEKTHAGQVVEQVVRPTGLVDPDVEVRPAAHQVDDLLQEIRERVQVNERVLVTTLTKRMAEQLTEYLADNGVKVRYLHSDVDTVERVEILRDLRLGSFDVLVGINLLREGLDLPEVSLVAILDADKEGFLRAERSLIQTIGRAARNVNGKAILYADKVTDSMKAAIDETERRRVKQIAHNAERGIVPRTVSKRVRDLIDGVVSDKTAKDEARAAKAAAEVEALDEKDLGRRIKALERQMLEHARNLEFEKAARVRDQLALLREQAFGASVHDAVVVPIAAAGVLSFPRGTFDADTFVLALPLSAGAEKY